MKNITSKELVPLKNKINTLVEQVQSIKIENAKDMQNATVVLSRLNQYADSVKAKKEKITKPLNETLKEVRAMFKPVEEPCVDAIWILREKMTVYQTEAVRIQNEEQAAIAARVKAGKGNLSIETAVKKMEEIERVDKEVATDAGLVQFREVKKFEVVDMGLLPIEYHIADEKAIGAKMKEGIEVPGVRYYTEQIPCNYR